MGGNHEYSLKVKNLALLAKWHWRFLDNEEALWKEVISEFYGPLHDRIRSNQLGNSSWNSIMEVNDYIETLGVGLKSSFYKSIANGYSSLFWETSLSAAGAKFKQLFPRLFAQEVDKSTLFKDRWKFESNSWIGSWCWRSNLRGRIVDELRNLEELLHNMSLKESGVDSWI